MHVNDTTFSATSTIAAILWAVGAIFIGLSFFHVSAFGQVGIYFAAAAGTCQIRGFICSLRQRERNAFELGRDSVRSIH